MHGLVVVPTRRWEGPEAVLARLFDLGRRVLAAAGPDLPVHAVGLSVGGPLDAATGVLTAPPHLPGWIDVPIVELTRREFGRPVVMENDATAAALAEFRFGAGRGVRTMIYLTISTGVGGGAVIDGRLHRGAAGNGGELGHLMVRPGGRPCTCGRRGCLEAYVSGTNIAARAAEGLRGGAGTGSSLATADPLTAADVSAAAAAGDPFARAIWAETTDLLGQAVTDLANLFEPELVVLGGGVTRAGALLLEPVAAKVAREAMGPVAAVVRLALAGLGDVVGVVGAGAVAMDVPA